MIVVSIAASREGASGVSRTRTSPRKSVRIQGKAVSNPKGIRYMLHVIDWHS